MGAGPAGRRSLTGFGLAVRILAAAVSLSVLVGSGWLWATYRHFKDNLHRVQAIDSSTRTAKDIDGKDQDILMIGSDDRESATKAERKEIGISRDGGAQLTDTMMLLHIPANGKRASAISFPRDTWVSIPGHGMNKLNSAYSDGMGDAKAAGAKTPDTVKAAGTRLLIRTLQGLTGLTIDHFVSVDMLGFYRISKAVGGVEVCLNAAQNAQTENDVASDPHPNGYSGINLKKGKNVIEGVQALAFVRQRHGLPRGDLDRIVRQQYFLSAVFRKVTSAGVLLSPVKLQNLLTAVSSSMTMDGSSGSHKGMDPLALAKQLQALSAGKLTFQTLPTTSDNIDGISVQRVDTANVPVFVGKILGTNTQSAYAKAAAVAPSQVAVTVLNGTAIPELASTSAATLAKVGFTTKVGDADTTNATVIRYPGGMEAQAKTVAQYVPGAATVQSDNVSVVTLVLGSDGRRASATKAAAKSAPAPNAKTGAQTAAKPAGRTAAQADCIN